MSNSTLRSSSSKFPLKKYKKQLLDLGAIITSGDISIVDLGPSDEAAEFLLTTIDSMENDQDPVIIPTFGIVGSITAQVQQEVFNIISTYEALLAADFIHGNIVPIAQAVNVQGHHNWHFHHAQMAVSGLIQRLQNPGPGPFTSTINALPGAAYICNLNLLYANVVFNFIIRKQ